MNSYAWKNPICTRIPIPQGDHFRFGSVFIKKSNQTEIFFKKKPKPNRNRVKPTGFGAVRFGFLGQKPIQTSLARFSRFWLGFFRFFSDFGSVRFGFFGFWLIKPKPNRTGRFFQNFNRFNRFFFSVWFFRLFFFWFSRFNRFFWFFCSPLLYHNTCHQLFVEHNSNKIMRYKIV